MWRKGILAYYWWECKLAQTLLKIICSFLKKLKIKLPHNPAVPFLGIFQRKTKTLIWKDRLTSMLTAALFTIAKVWKQPKCPSKDERINKCICICVCVYIYIKYIYMLYVYNGILLSHKKWIFPLGTTWMDLVLSEISQRKTNIIWFHLYVES